MAWAHRADEPAVQEGMRRPPSPRRRPLPTEGSHSGTDGRAYCRAHRRADGRTNRRAYTGSDGDARTDGRPHEHPGPDRGPTATPDPTAGWPDNIEAKDLASYGFDVTSSDGTVYQYTGWQEIDGVTYYYDPTTHQPVTGQQVIQGDVYTFRADGALNRTARGIDVSKFQGSIDWNAVKADGITFAIIRCGYRGYGSGALVEDSTYRANIQGAINAGLKVGVYFYSQAINEQGSR